MPSSEPQRNNVPPDAMATSAVARHRRTICRSAFAQRQPALRETFIAAPVPVAHGLSFQTSKARPRLRHDEPLRTTRPPRFHGRPWNSPDVADRGAPSMNSSIVDRLRSAGRLDRMFIDGEWVLPETQARSAVVDPSTEEPVAEIALGGAGDVAAAVAAARRAFATWSVTPAQGRALLLDRVHTLILERAERFAQAISLEMG